MLLGKQQLVGGTHPGQLERLWKWLKTSIRSARSFHDFATLKNLVEQLLTIDGACAGRTANSSLVVPVHDVMWNA